MLKVEQIVDDWVASPPMAYIMLREAIADPDSSFQDFSKILSMDPGLTVRLLRIVNSSWYGFSSQIETIQHALSIVGVDQISDLVLATTVMKSFQGIPDHLVDMDSFWSHSIACGLACRSLAVHLGHPELDRMNVVGMLHDIGSLVIYKKAPEEACKALKLSETMEVCLFEAEKKVMGFDHADVGASLLQAWKLPSRLVELVLFHHKPLQAKKFQEETAMIYLADILVHQMDFGNNGELVVPIPDENVLKILKIPEGSLEEIKGDLEQSFRETSQLFLCDV